MSRHIPAFWFRLLGFAKWKLELTGQGIDINDQHWTWEQLRRCNVTHGWFWRAVEIEGPTTLLLKRVPKSTADLLSAVSAIAVPIRAADAVIDQVLRADLYISEFDRNCLVDELRKHVSWDENAGAIQYLRHIPELEQQHKRVRRYISGDRREIDARNQHFVQAELMTWRDWFAQIEKTPLTEEQAKASVIMEDRNLLIAAAGSGKTSTIVAKAAYALAKGYCEAGELLVLTFNRRIREELKERLEKRLSAVGLPTAITVETFNAFGYRQVKKQNKNTRLAPWADSPAKETAHLRALTNSLVKSNPAFAYALAEFSAVWLESDEKEEGEILAATDTGSFQDAMRKLLSRAAPKGSIPTYTTLAGGTVRSLQELRICNWLTLMGVQYEYERPFPDNYVPKHWQSGYRPDFYYPAIDCWHEHFGLNKLGKAPPWMSGAANGRQRTYEDEVVEKRQLLARSRVNWFETTSADFETGTWENKLEGELRQRGVSPSFIGWERFLADFKSAEFVTRDVVGLVLTCLRHAKSNRLSPADVKAKVAETLNPRARAFLNVCAPVYEAYQINLRERGELDFEDMVILSADAFQQGRFRHPYRLILVDEFQDVSNSRAELISSMLLQSPDIRLFGVGDDWQSIYRFAGADISAMTQFASRYGYTETSYLTRTFRSNQFIADAASHFIMRNPTQLRKQVKASTPGGPASIEVVFHTGRSDEFLLHELSVLAQQHKHAPRKPSVMLLGRYNFLKPDALETWQHQYADEIDLSFLTIHRSKGLEADYVFLLGASNKKGQDFPSTIQDDPLLSLFMPVADRMAWSEERRLFYVALTRARQKAYIMAPEGQASSFVSELLASHPVYRSLYNGGNRTDIADERPYIRLPPCPKCEKGSVMRRVSEYGPFEFCTLKCGYKKDLKFNA